ncbi:hypothetical protein F7725_005023 [Dissostichus mawsoni]|uniref:tRNA-binding domain-containing protein n=1 Tax=Dissostichus mawsoni TaxID=36200 RepID=A0A7J5XLY5_DISMA|nr:hypothetical protein F7725_005023 [Dissostichus mawsoni]
MKNMKYTDNMDSIFDPDALIKLDPEDGPHFVEYFQTHAMLSREKAQLQASVRDQRKLLVENGKLKKDIEQLKTQLQDKQKRRTAKVLFSPAPPPTTTSPAPNTETAAVPTNPPPPSSQDRRDRQSRRKRGDRKVDVSRLDLRVGRILSVRPHPLAETLSVQEVDVGENAPRTVVSKLGAQTDLEEGVLAVLLCNVKACKLRGVASKARLLVCSASDDDVTERLAPPTGSDPGDRPELQVDSKGVANYKGCGFEVKGKGLCRAPSLTNCNIK